MDTKSLAKSKRAHSLHLNKKHSHHQAGKAPSTSSGGSKNVTGKQTGAKPLPSHGSRTLPSNYDRYDEDLESEDTAQESSSEFVVPKSKGADYKYLISEATAQSQSSYSSDGFLLFNDGLEDFTQDFGPLLAAKGQSILSWIIDDNFDYEDQASASQEASFMSLDLNDLAMQLAKAKPSERLFVEPDLLPPELLDDYLHARSEAHEKVIIGSPAVTLDSGLDHEDRKPMSRSIAISEENPAKDEISVFQETFSILPNSFSTHNADSASGSVPTFEAANAEAELDMLLNSFNETEFLQPSSSSTSRNLSTAAVTSYDLPTSSHPSSKSKIMDDFDSWLDTI